MSAGIDPQLLAEAIVAYTGHGTSKRPVDDREAVDRLSVERGVEVFPAVEAALQDAEALDMSDIPIPSDTAGDAYRSRLHSLRPDLTGDAIAALANRWFYRRLWLGLPAEAKHPRVRYFARFANENGRQVPSALYRREDDGTSIVDSVLEDVGTWREDRNRVVWSSFANPLESDVEPISAAQAQEFEKMVAERRYRPFSAR
ncbi:hypothetical protein ACFUTX_11230 [Microbacterium sp. NPDC057407]|uniref:hypothetical protein n=1 Tax=Microbacterium sp. NPDC057407 TaxID=3346120 RepID=UPI003672F593